MLSAVQNHIPTMEKRAPVALATPLAAEQPRASDSVCLSGAPEAAVTSPDPEGVLGVASSIASTIGGAIGATISAWAAGIRFVGFGAVYKMEQFITQLREQINSPLENVPTPAITTPFVIVPGWTTRTEAFDGLVNHLTRNGANGGQCFYVQQGAFFTKDADGDLQPAPSVPADAKVFEMVFSDNRQSPDKNVLEMRVNFDAIKRVSGASQVDVQGFSMGGINSRLYIDQGGGADIRRLLMLGTPNRGTHFANLAKEVLDKNVLWAAGVGALQKDDVAALQWLRPEDENPALADLNSRWDSQRRTVPSLTVGTDVMPTPGRDTLSGIVWGDGLVDAESLKLPKGHTIVLHEAMQHGRLNNDETMQHVRAVFFEWALPLNAADLFPEGDSVYVDQVPKFTPATGQTVP
jgi:hypothetical protein